MGRLVDMRNFPDVAADILFGKRLAYLGLGYKGERKALAPKNQVPGKISCGK